MTPVQIDLFDLPAAVAPPAPVPEQSTISWPVHWLVVTTRKAGTACGRVITSYQHRTREAVSEDGDTIRCTIDLFNVAVSCPRCLEFRG